MIASPLSNEIALRIGLAARELPDTDPARLLRVLDKSIGLPPSIQALSELTVKGLKSAGDGEFADVDVDSIKAALVCLKGETDLQSEPLPEVMPYAEDDIPNSIRVACGSNRGELLDGHFGSCRRFLIYQVAADEARLIEIRNVDSSQEAGDKNGYRAALISDCQLLFVASIGAPAASKVVRVGVHPIKKPQGGAARDEIQALQKVVGKDAPPWLAKVMGCGAEQRVRFEREDAE